VCVLALYTATLSDNHTEAEDALHYAASISSGETARLFHPNHLLFNMVGLAAFRLARTFGYSGDPMLPLQVLNAIAGSLTAGLLTRIGLRRGYGRALSALAALGCAVSYGVWWYSVEAETYVLPLPFVVYAMDRTITSGARPTFGRGAGVGVLAAAATLLHQQHALAFLPLGLGLWLASPRNECTYDRAVPLAGMAAAAAVVVGLPYILIPVLIYGSDSLASVMHWALGHAGGGPWEPVASSNVIKALVGFTRSLIGLHFIFSFDAVSNAVGQAFPAKILIEERFLAGTINSASRVAALIASAATAATGVALLLEAWRSRTGAVSKRGGGFLASVVCAVAAYSVANVFWEPANPEFWIAVIPWLFLGLAEILNRGDRVARSTRILGLFVASLALANFIGSVYPQTTREGDYWYQANRELFKLARPSDLIISGGGYISDGYLERATSAEVIAVGRTPPAELQQRIGEHKGRLIISSWAIEPPSELARSRQFASWQQERTKKILEPCLTRASRRVDGRYQTLWVVEHE
jgi:hypothetical protein